MRRWHIFVGIASFFISMKPFLKRAVLDLGISSNDLSILQAFGSAIFAPLFLEVPSFAPFRFGILLALFCGSLTFGASTFATYAMELKSPSVVSLSIMALQMVMNYAWGILLGFEPLRLQKIIGLILMITGLIIFNR